MVIPAHVVFAAERARIIIEEETFRSVNSETGGLLVGRLIEYDGKPVLVIVAATGPGPRADRRPLYYGSDQAYLQRELEALREEFSEFGVDYVGEWHKHPPDIPELSRGDVDQARKILGDSDYSLPGNGLLLPLTFLKEEIFEQRCFYLSRELSEPLEIASSDVAQETMGELLEEVLGIPPEPLKTANFVFHVETSHTPVSYTHLTLPTKRIV